MVKKHPGITPIGYEKGSYSKLEPPFSEAVDTYFSLDGEAERISERRLKANACMGSVFFYYLQEKGFTSFEQITEDDVIPFFLKDGKPKYCSNYRSHLAQFLMAVSVQYPECEKISVWIPHIRTTRKNIQYLTEGEAAAVKKACISSDNKLSYLDKAVGIILLYTGMRGCDIASLKLNDIDWVKEEIHIVQSKTSVSLTLPLLVIVGNAIFDYLENERHSEEECLFVTSVGNSFTAEDVRRCAERIFKASGIRQNKGDRKGTHIFRHHLATQLLANNVPQPVISQTLGHTNPMSVEAYLSVDIKHLRECALSIEDYAVDWRVLDYA